MSHMDVKQKEVLSLLGYFFLRNNKTDKALILFRVLQDLFPDEPLFAKALSYGCMLAGDHKTSLAAAERYLACEKRPELQAIGYLLQSRAYWGLEEHTKARESMASYLTRKDLGNGPEPG